MAVYRHNSLLPEYSDHLQQGPIDAELHESNDANVDAEFLREFTFATTTIGITMREEGTCKVEESVYGAAIVMPQLARTVGWNKTFALLAVRSGFFLSLNIFLQSMLLTLIAEEEDVMDLYGGKMFLCDFGANLKTCPGPGCAGPGGKPVTPFSVYNWESVFNRNFVKNSLKALFPDMVEEIDDKVIPGEYGIQSNECRYICCFVFMLACMNELVQIWKIVQLLYKIPTRAEDWMYPREHAAPTGKLEDVVLKIAGMPMIWKVLNCILVILPKSVLWILTVQTGVQFLMDTSGISDLVINSVALAFILAIGELIMTTLTSEAELTFVKAVEDYALYDPKTSIVGDISLLSNDEILEQYYKVEFSIRSLGWKDLSFVLPYKFLISLACTWIFVKIYYHKHCILYDDDGSQQWVSRPMHYPKSAAFSWWNACLPMFFPVQVEEETFWEMPSH